MTEDFSRQLEDALARKAAPPGFEARVLATARAKRPRGWTGFVFARRVQWIAAVAALALVISGITWQLERAREERTAGEAAKARLELALKITSDKLRSIEERVRAARNLE